MLFDPQNYPNLFIRGKSVNLCFTTNIRKNHAYNQRTKRLRDTSEGEILYFIVYGQRLIVTFGKYSASGRDRPVILQFKFFPTDRALSILREKTGENFRSGTVQIESICLLLYSPGVSIGLIQHGFRRHLVNEFAKRSEITVFVRKSDVQIACERRRISGGVTAFCVPPWYLFPQTLGTSALCSPSPPHKTIQCYVFPSSRMILGLNKTKVSI